METIQNEYLTVKINTLGAELSSVKPADGIERLWQGSEALWNRKAPNLFPIIGRLKDSQYQWEGKTYHISTHGFARDLPFAVVEKGTDTITLALTHSPETWQVYPFAFRLEITYALEGKTIRKTHRIVNQGERVMPYEMGGHEGWNTTLHPGETMGDYWLEFPGLDALTPYRMAVDTCFLQRERVELPMTEGRYSLPPDTKGMDTVVLSGVHQVTLAGKAGPVVTVSCPDYDYLAIWTTNKVAETNYICLEPWTTLPEADYVGADLGEKVGIRILQPGQQEIFTYTMEIH